MLHYHNIYLQYYGGAKNLESLEIRNQFYVKDYSESNPLPMQYDVNLTKLMKKLQQADIGQNFKTAFNKSKTIFTFARLDYNRFGITLDLKDNLGNDAYVMVNGEKYHPVSIRENLLDVTVLKLRSNASGKNFGVYRLNRKSPLFVYAENLKQITSWSAIHMALPCRKSIQNAIIASYLLTKISLIKNPKNHYLNTGILFDTLYEELNLDVSTRKKKKAIRDNIQLMFDYWVKSKLLISYEFMKVGKTFHKIVFNVNLSEV